MAATFFSLITFLKLGFEYGMEWSLKLRGIGGYEILKDWNGDENPEGMTSQCKKA